MRKILFRGKRVNNGEWVVGDLFNTTKIVITTTSNKGIYTENGSDIFKYEYIEVHPDTIGQFTGLTDKNGKEIFDGDIFTDSLGNKAIVEWDERNARYLGFSIENRAIMYIGREPKVTVIGNIHDNPELLKQ